MCHVLLHSLQSLQSTWDTGWHSFATGPVLGIQAKADNQQLLTAATRLASGARAHNNINLHKSPELHDAALSRLRASTVTQRVGHDHAKQRATSRRRLAAAAHAVLVALASVQVQCLARLLALALARELLVVGAVSGALLDARVGVLVVELVIALAVCVREKGAVHAWQRVRREIASIHRPCQCTSHCMYADGAPTWWARLTAGLVVTHTHELGALGTVKLTLVGLLVLLVELVAVCGGGHA
jgi:hypothetical protein